MSGVWSNEKQGPNMLVWHEKENALRRSGGDFGVKEMNMALSQEMINLQSPEILAQLGYVPMAAGPEPKKPKQKKMTKTEAKFIRDWIEPRIKSGEFDGYIFEGLRIGLQNGHFYTPDFVCRKGLGVKTVIEVKGTYKLQSYQRARMAYDQAKLEWPEFSWMWYELNKETGAWDRH